MHRDLFNLFWADAMSKAEEGEVKSVDYKDADQPQLNFTVGPQSHNTPKHENIFTEP